MRYVLLLLVIAASASAQTSGAQQYVVTKVEEAGRGWAVTLRRAKGVPLRVHLWPSSTDEDKNCTDVLAKGDTVSMHSVSALKAEFVHDRTGAICSGPRERMYSIQGLRKPVPMPGMRRVWKRDSSRELISPDKPEAFSTKALVYQEIIITDGREALKVFAAPGFSSGANVHGDDDCVFQRGDSLAVYELQDGLLRGGGVAFAHRARAAYDECSISLEASKLLAESFPAVVSVGKEGPAGPSK